MKTFVFLSTTGIYGHLASRRCLDEASPLSPLSYYSMSKLFAEYLLELPPANSLRTYTIRAPMIYGPHCPGNLALLFRVAKAIQLIFTSFTSPRSLLSISNLVHVLARFTRIPAPLPSTTYLLADPFTLSVAQIMSAFYRFTSTPYLPFPSSIPLQSLCSTKFAPAILQKLASGPIIDSTKIYEDLHVTPRSFLVLKH